MADYNRISNGFAQFRRELHRGGQGPTSRAGGKGKGMPSGGGKGKGAPGGGGKGKGCPVDWFF